MGICCCTAADDSVEHGRRWPRAANPGSHLLAGSGAAANEPFDPRSPNAVAGYTRTPYQGQAGRLRWEGAAKATVGIRSGSGAFQPVRSSNNQLGASSTDPDATGHGVGMYGSAPPKTGHTASGSL